MNPLAKRKEIAKAKQYIFDHPTCTYAELIKDLRSQSLSKPYFFNIRGALRKQGKITATEKSTDTTRPDAKRKIGDNVNRSGLGTTKVEIIDSIDASALTPALKEHWKEAVLPLLQKHIPDGKSIEFVFLAEPPILEIRRTLK